MHFSPYGSRTVLPRSLYVCSRCTSYQTRSFSASRLYRNSPASPPAAGYAPLSSRTLISVTGSDAPKFLHGLVTSSVTAPTPSTPGFYTAFLTAPGKVLYDAFVYPFTSISDRSEAGFIVEVDAGQRANLLKHLKRHKLRSKVTVRTLEDGEMKPYALWRPDSRWTPHGLGGGETPPSLTGMLQLVDGRASGLGRRVLVADGAETTSLFTDLEKSTLEQYAVRRYVRGVPEGAAEIAPDATLPFNANLDAMAAIDFRKGCYLGQELTIRTHHTGVVRRRILPVMIYDAAANPPDKLTYSSVSKVAAPQPETEFAVEGKRGKPGKWIAGVGNIGLAMCRLEMMTDITVTNEASAFDDNDRFTVEGTDGKRLGVRAFVPDWLRGKIRPQKVQKRIE